MERPKSNRGGDEVLGGGSAFDPRIPALLNAAAPRCEDLPGHRGPKVDENVSKRLRRIWQKKQLPAGGEAKRRVKRRGRAPDVSHLVRTGAIGPHEVVDDDAGREWARNEV